MHNDFRLYKGVVPLWGRQVPCKFPAKTFLTDSVLLFFVVDSEQRNNEWILLFVADTMMKFASYENIVEMIYKHAIPTPKEDCTKTLQLGVSVVGGYLAGILCAVVSHPADNLVSFLNSSKGATAADVSAAFILFWSKDKYLIQFINYHNTRYSLYY